MLPDQLFKHAAKLKGFKLGDDLQWSGLYPSLHDPKQSKRRHTEHGLEWLLDWLPAGWEIHCDRTAEGLYTNIDLIHESPGREYKLALERLLDEFAHKVQNIVADDGYLQQACAYGKFPPKLERMLTFRQAKQSSRRGPVDFYTGTRDTHLNNPPVPTLPRQINPSFDLGHRFLKGEFAIQFGEDWIVSAHVYFGWKEDFNSSAGPYRAHRHDWLVVRGIREGWNTKVNVTQWFQNGLEQGASNYPTPAKATEAAGYDYLVTANWKKQCVGKSPVDHWPDTKFLMDHGTELGSGGYDSQLRAKEDADKITSDSKRIIKLPLDASLFGTAKWFVKAHEMVVEGTKNSNPYPGASKS